MLTAIDKERIAHINSIMDDLHSCMNGIYESLVDRDYGELKKEISCAHKQLKSLSNSIENV